MEAANYWTSFGTEIFEGKFTRQVFPWHYHDSYTVVMVDSGGVEYIFRDKNINVQPGQVFIINPYDAHYNRAAEKNGWMYKVFFLPIQLFNSRKNLFSIINFDRTPISNQTLYSQLGQLHEKLKVVIEESDYFTIIHEVSKLLLIHYPAKAIEIKINERIEPAIKYIEAHLDEKLTIKKLAQVCHTSHFYFQRLFKQNTGLTVNAFIHQKRMELSRRLLQTDINVAGTAIETGYFDQSHFHHQFKKMYGLTPRQFSLQ